MKLTTAFLLSVVASQDFFTEDDAERKKNKNKNLVHDACGCNERPQNGADAIATCVENNGRRKTIDWTCPATGVVTRHENIRCRKLRTDKLIENCGIVCKCDPEMDAHIALMNPVARYECDPRPSIKRPLYRVFCDTNSNQVFDWDNEVSESHIIKCRRGNIRKNPFNVTLCD